MLMVHNELPIEKENCRHCQQELTPSQEEFCCSGCDMAYQFIHSLNMDNFYQLVQDRKLATANAFAESSVDIFDNDEFNASFCASVQENRKEARLNVGGLTCYACIWLIKSTLETRWPDLNVQISLSSGETLINFDPKTERLSELVRFIRRLGFRVAPGSEAGTNWRDLIRLGVTTFCFLNIMLVSVPEYVDASLIEHSTFWNLFRFISLGLGSIAVFYGAAPMLRSAWSSLKGRKLNIDQSLVFALLCTFVFSAINTIRLEGNVYFDSVAAIITLIGWGRYFQKRVMQNAESSIRGAFDFSTQYLRVVHESSETLIPLTKVKVGQRLKILPGEPVGVSSRLESPSAQVSLEQLTGEAKPMVVKQGEVLRSGSLVLGHPVAVSALEDGSVSFMAKMNRLLENIFHEQGAMSLKSDRIASIFFAIVFLLSLGILFTQWGSSPEEAMSRTIAALLIACPCAFAIAVPMTMASCAANALKRGVIIKSQRSIEQLASAQTWFFDKTGTLTAGHPSVIANRIDHDVLAGEGLERSDLEAVLVVLHRYSEHHVLGALAAFFQGSYKDVQINRFQESPGQGVTFESLGKVWKVGNVSFLGLGKAGKSANVWVSVNGIEVASFELEDPILPDTMHTIMSLKTRGFDLGLISGDSAVKTDKFAKSIGLDSERVFSEQDPMQKSRLLSDAGQGPMVMIGNGFNDSLAMANAHVGVCVANANEQAKSSADICLQNPGLGGLTVAYDLCRKAIKKVRQSFVFAVCFNLTGIALAAVGLMHPVVAAVAMPISSVTVILISSRWS